MKIRSDLGNRHPVTIDQLMMPAVELLEGWPQPKICLQSLKSFIKWPWTTQRVCDFRLTLLKPMIKYQIAAINNYWEKCYEHLGTNGRTEVKQYTHPPLILFWKAFSLFSCTSEPYNKICFDIIHIHCNKQLFFNKITSKFQEKIWCARRASILSKFGFIPVSS
jgi:hypothetical protein